MSGKTRGRCYHLGKICEHSFSKSQETFEIWSVTFVNVFYETSTYQVKPWQDFQILSCNQWNLPTLSCYERTYDIVGHFHAAYLFLKNGLISSTLRPITTKLHKMLD